MNKSYLIALGMGAIIGAILSASIMNSRPAVAPLKIPNTAVITVVTTTVAIDIVAEKEKCDTLGGTFIDTGNITYNLGLQENRTRLDYEIFCTVTKRSFPFDYKFSN